jgi:hypothetical protein
MKHTAQTIQGEINALGRAAGLLARINPSEVDVLARRVCQTVQRESGADGAVMCPYIAGLMRDALSIIPEPEWQVRLEAGSAFYAYTICDVATRKPLTPDAYCYGWKVMSQEESLMEQFSIDLPFPAGLPFHCWVTVTHQAFPGVKVHIDGSWYYRQADLRRDSRKYVSMGLVNPVVSMSPTTGNYACLTLSTGDHFGHENIDTPEALYTGLRVLAHDRATEIAREIYSTARDQLLPNLVANPNTRSAN